MSNRNAARLARIQSRGVSTLRGYSMPDVIYNYPMEGKWTGPTAVGSLFVGGPTGAAVLPAVMRATSLIADTIAGLPWRNIKDRETSDCPRWITDPQMLRPDGRLGSYYRWPGSLNRMEFWSQLITSMLWHGNGFLWSAEDLNGQPRPGFPFFKILNPVDVTWDDQWGYMIGGEPLELLGGRLIHIRGLAPYDKNGWGQGVIQRHAADLELAGDVRDYATNTFHSGVPSGYLQVTAQNLSKDQADALKSKWIEAHGDARTIAVLNSTTQFHPLSISPLDAQLVEQKKMSLQDVALMFGLDPTFLGAPSGDSATYANVESRQIIFAQHTLTPWARRIEETLSAEFPEGTWVEIDMRGLMRGDTSTRVDYYTAGLSQGWMTVDEVRAIERLPIMPNEPLPAQPDWPGRGEEVDPGEQFNDPAVTPESFTEE